MKTEKKSKRVLGIKRAYDPPQATDGYRILVDRLWPRGIKKEALPLDGWAKEMAPSAAVRQAFGHAPERFARFEQDYRRELEVNPAALDFLALLQKQLTFHNVTLLYAARDERYNQAVILKAWAQEKLKDGKNQ